MTKLNLTAKGTFQERILAYLQENASDTLADKINNGVPIEKDGKRLINKKTLDGFMTYAYDEAKKQVEKGTRATWVDDPIVFGWAVHYFEEASIEGKLYTEDGTEFKPSRPSNPTKAPTFSAPQAPKPKPQLSLFDTPETPSESAPPEDIAPQQTTVPAPEEEPSEEEIKEVFAELDDELPPSPKIDMETGEVLQTELISDEPNDELEKELELAKAFHPDALCRLFEIFENELIMR